ncbi:MAG: hypothetical protein DI626_07975, partial [Micavibrio aeruginosavorus]
MLTPVAKAGFWAAFLALFIAFIWVFDSVLMPFILGIIIAYLLDPVMRRFGKKHVPRWAAALLILFLFFLTIALLFVALAPMAFRQAEMLIEQMPTYIQSLMDYASPYLGWLQNQMGADYVEQITSYLKDSAGKIVTATGGIAAGIATGGKVVISFMTTLVLTPLVAFFMMKEWPHIVRWVEGL